MIKEYRIDPEAVWDDAKQGYRMNWGARCSVDLRYVTSAQPEETFTYIRYVGHPTGMAIDAPYEQFMRDWQSVKR